MIFPQLLVSLCLSAVTRGELVPEDIAAVEPQSFEAAVEAGSRNATFDARYGGIPVKYGAHIERVTLTKCPHYQSYLPNFYSGLVVNSRAWKTKNNERFTSVALAQKDNTIISSSSGAWPPKKDQLYHSWEMLHFGTSSQDIRYNNPGTIYFWTWNAMQQIYFPLYISSLESGTAYMLHLYPQASFLLNPPSDSTFTDGLFWAKGDQNRLYKIEINLEGLIQNLDDFSVPSYEKYIKAWGVVRKDAQCWQDHLAYPYSRRVDLRSTTLGGSNEYICHDSINSMDLTWSQMRLRLQRELTWL